MRAKFSRIFLGLFFVIFGAVSLCNIFGIINLPAIESWWAIFIIVLGISLIISSGINWFNCFITLLGVLIIAKNNIEAAKDTSWWLIIISILLLCIGISLVAKSFRKNNITVTSNYDDTIFSSVEYTNIQYNSDDLKRINISSSFSEKKEKLSCIITGGNISNSFGKLIIDLSECSVISDSTVFANCNFGELIIIAPTKCRLNIESSPFAGKCDYSNEYDINTELPVLNIKASVAFGHAVITKLK